MVYVKVAMKGPQLMKAQHKIEEFTMPVKCKKPFNVLETMDEIRKVWE